MNVFNVFVKNILTVIINIILLFMYKYLKKYINIDIF